MPFTGAVITASLLAFSVSFANLARRSLYVVAPAFFASDLNLMRFLPSRSSTVLLGSSGFGNSSCWSDSVTVCGSVDQTSAVTSYGWPTLISSGTSTPTTRISLVLSWSNVRHETFTPSSLARYDSTATSPTVWLPSERMTMRGR